MAMTNCWEFFKCPVERRQACTAFTMNAGRICWLVTGTQCGGITQNARDLKIAECRCACDFFLKLQAKEV